MRFIIIGSGKAAIDTARILKADDTAALVGLVGDPRHETAQSSLEALAAKLELPYQAATRLSTPEVLAFVGGLKPDYIISANNYMIFKREMLDLPTYGTVNFHNGPLPDYAGLNPISWAILNGEREYGIAWHFVDEGIDTGDIIHVERFPFEPDITVVRAIMKVIMGGMSSFKTIVLPQLLSREFSPVVQDSGQRRYFAGKDRPENGDLPWWWPEDRLEPLSRALWFAPLANGYYRPRVITADRRDVFAERFEFLAEAISEPPGSVLKADVDGIEIAVAGGRLSIPEIYADSDVRKAEALNPVEIGLKTGDVLRQPDQYNGN
ncbi:methionyl-tRNA formyltransferase [Hyphobacterium sp.]|uniref:methionyl-tRNA formyltransferase n=1 Tax=Hyphobacterium sp. TaxID=2004662 RepID=UPI003BAC8B0F